MTKVDISIPYSPRWFFREFHGSTARFQCVVAHRRAGKTVACLNDAVKDVLTCELPNPRASYVAPTYQQAKDIVWTYLKEFTRAIPGMKFHESELTATFPTGAKFRLYGAENYDRMRGIYNDRVILDEPADMAPEAWHEVIRPTLSDRRGRATFIGTPKGRNIFYDIYRLATKHKDWYSCVLPYTFTNVLDADEIEDARATMPPNAFRREYLCDFTVEAEDQLISVADCEQSAEREVHKGIGPVLLGVDVARFGDDRTVFMVRDGDELPLVEPRYGMDLMQVSSHAYALAMRNNVQRVFVDGAGVGGGVVDRMRQLGMRNIVDVNGGRRAMDEGSFFNLRSEMWSKMAVWIRERGKLPDSRELVDDLTAPTFKYDQKNRLKLEPKEELKKRGMPSPDLADALALTFAEPVRVRDLHGKQGLGAQAAAIADPFDDPIVNHGSARSSNAFEEFI